jgi:hypothetical protein
MRTRALRGAEVRLDHISEVEDDITDLFITRIEAIKAELPEKKQEYKIKIVTKDNTGQVWDSNITHGLTLEDQAFNDCLSQVHTILDNEIKRLKGEV